MLRHVRNETDPEAFDKCRVGHVDDHGVGLYCDPLEFLANDGLMTDVGQHEALA